jgi:hypothetical protein
MSSRNEAAPGRHADGGNLYLVVDKSGARRWVFLFRWEGRLREMGLGGVTSVPLAKARELAAEARALLADGVNPLERKRAEAVPTFGWTISIEVSLHGRSGGASPSDESRPSVVPAWNASVDPLAMVP